MTNPADARANRMTDIREKLSGVVSLIQAVGMAAAALDDGDRPAMEMLAEVAELRLADAIHEFDAYCGVGSQ